MRRGRALTGNALTAISTSQISPPAKSTIIMKIFVKLATENLILEVKFALSVPNLYSPSP